MNRIYTDIVKFICCILIFLHHFYLEKNIVIPLGYMSCSIFFFLSAWGISMSLDKRKLSLWQFIKRRVVKVYIPLLLVNFIFILAAIIATWNLTIVPVFSVFCDGVSINSIGSPLCSTAYLFDIFQIDSITWFVHVLLLVYLFVWAIHKINSKRLYAIVVVASFIAVELMLLFIQSSIWYRVDIVGVLLGLLIYKFDGMSRVIPFLHILTVGSVLLLVGALTLFFMHTEVHSWILLTGFLYSAAIVFLVWMLGRKMFLNKPMTGTSLWGGYLISFICYTSR